MIRSRIVLGGGGESRGSQHEQRQCGGEREQRGRANGTHMPALSHSPIRKWSAPIGAATVREPVSFVCGAQSEPTPLRSRLCLNTRGLLFGEPAPNNETWIYFRSPSRPGRPATREKWSSRAFARRSAWNTTLTAVCISPTATSGSSPDK